MRVVVGFLDGELCAKKRTKTKCRVKDSVSGLRKACIQHHHP